MLRHLQQLPLRHREAAASRRSLYCCAIGCQFFAGTTVAAAICFALANTCALLALPSDNANYHRRQIYHTQPYSLPRVDLSLPLTRAAARGFALALIARCVATLIACCAVDMMCFLFLGTACAPPATALLCCRAGDCFEEAAGKLYKVLRRNQNNKTLSPVPVKTRF